MHRNKNASRIFTSLLVVLTVGYGLFQARALIMGPQLALFSPTAGTVSGTTYTVRGKALHVREVTLNGRPIPLDAQGMFEETLLVPEGLTSLVLTGSNRFGRVAEERVMIVGRPVRSGPTLSTRTTPSQAPITPQGTTIE